MSNTNNNNTDHDSTLPRDIRAKKLIEDAKKQVGALGRVEVVDENAYNEFVRLCNNPIFHPPHNVIKASNGKLIKLGLLNHQIQKAVEDLPKKERDMILAKRKIYSNLLNTRNAKLKQAFKLQVRRDADTVTRFSQFAKREQQIIDLFGRMFSVQEVHEICLRDWQLPVTIANVVDFRTANLKAINEKIEVHKRDYSDIRLGYKRSRLEELTWLYLTRKSIYDATKKAEDHRLLLQTIEQIRKEVEGDTLRIDGKINFDVEQTIENQIKKELFRYLPLKEIILSRVAAKVGMDPTKLISDINTSYYGKYLMQNAEDIQHEEIKNYPSNQIYDFTQIHQQQVKIEKDKQLNQTKKSKEDLEKENQEQQTANQSKQVILDVLKSRQKKINASTSSAVARLLAKARGEDYSENQDDE
jgi:hypothetical protein